MSKKNRFSHQGSAVSQSLSFFTAYWFEIPVQFDLGHILVKNQLLKIARNSKENACLRGSITCPGDFLLPEEANLP